MGKQSESCKGKNPKHSDKLGNTKAEYDEPINLRRKVWAKYKISCKVNFADSVTRPHI